MNVVAEVLEHPRVYEVWQSPFADRKLRPLLVHNDFTRAHKVLDIACGPGTNARYFVGAEYLGVDINERYIRYARQRHGREFRTADVLEAPFPDNVRYDFILINSFLHHLDDAGVERTLSLVRRLAAPGGHVHLLELVMPAVPGPARLLARWDRGKHARSVERWRQLASAHLAVEVCEPYVLDVLGIPLWHMVYLRGAPI
jgi:SAM-dependent methyltransferase